MGVSYRGERMIGNMPFSLFNGHKKEDNQIFRKGILENIKRKRRKKMRTSH